MNSVLRFTFILFVLWLGLALVQFFSAPWLDDQVSGCIVAFTLQRPEQDAFDFLFCEGFDFIRKWGWLLVMTASVLAALALTFSFRRTAA